MNCTKKVFAGLVSVLVLVCGAQAAVIKMIDDGIATGAVGTDARMKRVTTDYHMTATNEYHLDGIVIVNSGVTLTIDAGTVIRGYNEVSTTANRPGTLIVDRGGKLYANGTAANPIIMTDQWDNNVPGETAGQVTRTWYYRAGGNSTKTMTDHIYDYSKIGNLHGVWGGLVLCGKAFVNFNKDVTPDLGDAQVPVEGVGTTAGVYGGGHDDNDSSGSITYVQIRYGGYTLADGSEINGMTFYGVGRGTVVHHIEVLNNQDDCFEWFGGTVNAKYLIGWGAGDDTFDSDCGFRGKNQFLFGVQRNLGGTKYESGCSDKGMEMDGAESVCVSDPSNTGMQEPFSASAWYNVTLVGWNGNAKGSYQRNGAVIMRDNATPQIKNSLFLNFGGFGTLIENKASVGNYYSRYHFDTDLLTANMPSTTATNILGDTIDSLYLYQSQQPGRQACIRDTVFWACGDETCPTGLSGTDPAYGGDGSKGPVFDNGDNLVLVGAGTDYDNADVFEDTDLPIQSLIVGSYDAATIWGSAAFGTLVGANTQVGDEVTQINPLAANGAVTAAHAVPNDGWLTPATYRGAFDTTNNWAQGWSAIAKLGAFGTYVPVEEQSSGGAFNGLSGVSGTFAATSGTAIGNYQLSSLLSFTGVAGSVYQLQSSPTVSGTYTAVKTFRCDTAGSKSIVDILGTAPASSTFYRIVEGSVD